MIDFFYSGKPKGGKNDKKPPLSKFQVNLTAELLSQLLTLARKLEQVSATEPLVFCFVE